MSNKTVSNDGFTDTAARTPEWILLAALSYGAMNMYDVLASLARQDEWEWPSRPFLAEITGWSRHKVNWYLRELAEIGAIEPDEGIVHLTMPEGFTGIASFEDQRPRDVRRLVPTPRQQKVWDRDGWRCVHCGERDRKKLTVDHIIPTSKGGTHDLDNLQTLCQSCNSSKCNREQVGPNRPKAAGR